MQKNIHWTVVLILSHESSKDTLFENVTNLIELRSQSGEGRGQGRSQDFSKGGSHCVKHYRHGVFATEYYRLFS